MNEKATKTLLVFYLEDVEGLEKFCKTKGSEGYEVTVFYPSLMRLRFNFKAKELKSYSILPIE